MEELITASDPEDDAAGGFLQELKADPVQPVARVAARCSTGTSAGHRPGHGKRLLFSARPPSYHVRWLVISKLARRQGSAGLSWRRRCAGSCPAPGWRKW